MTDSRQQQKVHLRPSPAWGGGASVPVILSLLFHLGFAGGIASLRADEEKPKIATVKVQIREIAKAKPALVEAVKEAIKAQPPKKEKPKKQPKAKKAASERKPKGPPVEAAKPVQGLAASALSPNGKGIAAPVGNTLMVADDGSRSRPEDIKALTQEDLSAEAKLIAATVVIPTYTDEAIDSNVEGLVIVDVYVSVSGIVTEVELRKKVGYGMDARILESARKVKFIPKKDRFGRASAGWSEIKFRLEIPG